jgi:hypothetical protein
MILGSFCFLLAVSILAAQEPPSFPKPQREHEWLQQLVGEWETENSMVAGPGDEKMECRGTMKSRMLGGFWVILELKTEVSGLTVNAVQTIGFDPREKTYVGSWVDSVISHLWRYEGTIDPTGKILTLEAEGPDLMHEGKNARYRDVYELKSKDHIATSSYMQNAEGKWDLFAQGSMRRKK